LRWAARTLLASVGVARVEDQVVTDAVSVLQSKPDPQRLNL
jgi:hypothetical protein